MTLAIVSSAPKPLIRPATRTAKHSRGELADQRHRTRLATIMCLRLHKVVRPDMTTRLWPQPYARAVIQPKVPPGLLLLGHFQPFPASDPLYAIRANFPSAGREQRCNPPIAITAIIAGQGDDGWPQLIFVWTSLGYIALRAKGMIQQAASTTL